MPIYVAKAKEAETDAVRLIKAKTSAGAMSFATRGLVEVELADAEVVHELATKGVKIEDASVEPAAPAPAEEIKQGGGLVGTGKSAE